MKYRLTCEIESIVLLGASVDDAAAAASAAAGGGETPISFSIAAVDMITCPYALDTDECLYRATARPRSGTGGCPI